MSSKTEHPKADRAKREAEAKLADGNGKPKAPAKAEAKAKPPKRGRTCPCCGGPTKSVFVQGHDARSLKLLKAHRDDPKANPLDEAPGLQAMFPVWSEDPDRPIKEIAIVAVPAA